MRALTRNWFAARTYHADDFDVADLAARKAASGLTVSVVLPTRDEVDTIEGVIQSVAELSGTLVDELVVIDGGSADGTPERAAVAGARVHDDSALMSELGRGQGKGDALWRSLSVTSGDIVVFVDSDIRNPSPRFVWGLLAPLLTDSRVQLVKAFYERPIEVQGVLHPTGGGRVTELLVRPLLNLLWPELAGLVQPLSGEYAGRRGLLEAIPFFTGYGVEVGMLVDTLALAGQDAIAQVDVGERIHRNQSIDALSRMAFGIAQVALTRAAAQDRLRLLDAPPARYVQFLRAEDGRIRPEPHDIQVLERPPLASYVSRSQRTP